MFIIQAGDTVTLNFYFYFILKTLWLLQDALGVDILQIYAMYCVVLTAICPRGRYFAQLYNLLRRSHFGYF